MTVAQIDSLKNGVVKFFRNKNLIKTQDRKKIQTRPTNILGMQLQIISNVNPLPLLYLKSHFWVTGTKI